MNTSEPQESCHGSINMSKAAINELLHGQKKVTELRSIISSIDSRLADGSPASLLINEVLNTITRSISMLESEQVTIVAGAGVATSSSDDQVSEISSKKRKNPVPRRSGYRRRTDSYSCKKVLSKTMDDAFTWRKYGQKEIFNATHPRHYFRCTHKYAKQCQATRQVQKCENDPSVFEITYMGEHICVDINTSPKSTYIINFEANINDEHKLAQEQQVSPNCDTNPPLMQELNNDEEEISCLTPGSSSSDLLVFQDLIPEIDDLEKVPTLEQCDVTSSFNDIINSEAFFDDFFNDYQM